MDKSSQDSRRIEDDVKDFADLKKAVKLLETPCLTAQITSLLGSPVEFLVKKLPSGAQNQIYGIVEAALHKAVKAALFTMDDEFTPASTKTHKALAAMTGAIGGVFGFAGLPFELPASTIIMMRSVADVARSEKFSLSDVHVQMQCVAVFGLEGKKSNSADAGYYAARAGMPAFAAAFSKELGKIAKDAANKGASKVSSEAAKWFAELIAKVATRFGVTITEKMAAQAVPVVGALTAATLNVLFTDFYQDMARGHFVVLRLEEKYGDPAIQTAYSKILNGK